MQTSLTTAFLKTNEGQEADAILRSCVHCGFCTATCPTYQLLGDELDGPRGRIYLIKQMLEGQPVTRETQLHLDRCLTCRACETTCPSGVRYGRLADIGRGIAEQQINRPWLERLLSSLAACGHSIRHALRCTAAHWSGTATCIAGRTAPQDSCTASAWRLAVATACTTHAGARRLRAIQHNTQHQCRYRTRTRSAGNITHRCTRGRLLRRTQPSSQCRG